MKKALCLALVVLFLLSPAIPVYAADGRSVPNLHRLAKEKEALNGDTVGWLRIPGTKIDEVVLCRNDPKDYNQYYYRRNFQQEYAFEGSLYADFRSTFGEGRYGLGRNTVIYGHALSDDPAGVKFAQLYRYLDKDFLEKNPVIYFSTTEETFAWEIYAVSLMDTDTPYNVPTLNDKELRSAIKKLRSNSLYPMEEITVGPEDHILTLSTMIYDATAFGVEEKLSYPNNYRLAVSARLID